MMSAKRPNYSELEKKVEEYVEAEYSIRIEESEHIDELVLESEEDIFDQLIALGNDIGSSSVSKQDNCNEYRLSLDNLF